MLKKILMVCTLLIMTTLAVAQEVVPEDLLNIDQYQKNQGKPYQGGTFVHIDLPQQRPNEPVFNPIPLLPTGNYIIKTPFGQKTEAAFVAHTTDFYSIIQVLNDTDVMMQQTIQFVNTKGQAHFTRTFDLPANVHMTLLKAKRDNKTIDTMRVWEEGQQWTVKDTAILSSGIYSYTLSYLIKGAIQPQENTRRLRISLTGPDWSLPTERFSAIVLLPKKSSVKSHTLLFGSNNAQIEDSFTSQTDDKGIMYRLTRPLPAYADVKVDMVLDKNIYTISFTEWLSRHFNHLLFFLCLGVLLVYTLLTYWYLVRHKNKHLPVKELKYYSYVSLRFITGNLSNRFLQALSVYLTQTQKKHKTILFLMAHPQFIKPFVFMNVMRKYIGTMLLIIALTVFQAHNTGFSLTPAEIITLIITAFILNIGLYKTAEKTYVRTKMAQLTKILFETDITFGASVSSLKALYVRFYPYALIMNKEDEWTRLMKKHKVDVADYHFNQEQA